MSKCWARRTRARDGDAAETRRTPWEATVGARGAGERSGSVCVVYKLYPRARGRRGRVGGRTAEAEAARARVIEATTTRSSGFGIVARHLARRAVRRSTVIFPTGALTRVAYALSRASMSASKFLFSNLGEYRFAGTPSLPMRNFSKFHVMSDRRTGDH